jgi:tyrosinase
VVGTSCPACSATASAAQRIRKNVISLSSQEVASFAAALNIMKTTSAVDGRRKFGSSFRNYDYLVAKHCVAAADTRGDQAHFSSAFMTFHSLLILEFESSLLAIDPSIGATPYWDWTATGASAKVFTSTMFGSVPGTGTNSQVIDGLFPNWPIMALSQSIFDAKFKSNLSDATYNGYTGSTSNGFLRGTKSTNTNQYNTRYGRVPSVPTKGSSSACASTSVFPWIKWYACIETGDSGGPSPSFHSNPHPSIGGSSGTSQGDFLDPVSSPNDPIFMLHHANLDRNKLHWMSANSDSVSYFYGYPINGQLTPANGTRTGLGLAQAVSSTWGFTDGDVGIQAHASAPSTLWTHADALCHLSPTVSPYTYDTLSMGEVGRNLKEQAIDGGDSGSLKQENRKLPADVAPSTTLKPTSSLATVVNARRHGAGLGPAGSPAPGP